MKDSLFRVAKMDSGHVIRQLHGKGLDLNAIDDKGQTGVFYAKENRSTNALYELIQCKADFNLDATDDECAKGVLFKAAEMDSRHVISRLHLKGLDLNATDGDGKTAVFYANENRITNALYELIQCNADFKLDAIDDECAKSVLFKAAEMDSRHVIWRLHMKGIDLNATDNDGKTAVFYAKKNKSTYALCQLIQYGASFKLESIGDDFAMDVFFKAAKTDCSHVIWRLHVEGLNLNATDDEGKSAVFYANKNKSTYALRELIQWDVYFKLDDIDDDCAKDVLLMAAEMDSDHVIWRLHLEGLDLNVTDDDGKTAVFHANENANTYALCELIAGGAKFKLDEINAKDLLFFASKNGKSNIIEPLYNAGIDLQQTDDEGKTVVFHCDKQFLEALAALDDNVLINARDVFGRTPLFYAARDGELSKAQYLIEKGGNIQLKDNCNVNIFSFCIQWYITKHSVLSLPSLPLFDEPHRAKELVIAIIDSVYCKSPLLSISIPLPHFDGNLDKEGILKALAFGLDKCSIHDVGKVNNIKEVISKIKEKKVDVPLVMSLLNKLGADPNASDSDGNTAVHYATLLPFFGVTQEVVINICKILRKFGSVFYLKNHQDESPLQLCLSSKVWKAVGEHNRSQPSVIGLVEICRCLIRNRCSITQRSQNAESIFHRIVSLIQQSLEITERTHGMDAIQVLIDILILLSPNEAAVRTAVNNPDAQLNSPLHLWASIALKQPQSYSSLVSEEHTFESILQIIFDHLSKCGSNLNLRNCNQETPLHVCQTWTAVKMLLDAGANPKDVDASGNSPLLAAAKRKNLHDTDFIYPDVNEDQETFWKSALKNKLDPWVVDKQEVSIMNILIKSKFFIPARALVNVACKNNHATNATKLSLLNAICIDESKDTHTGRKN